MGKLEDLYSYNPVIRKEADFESFWNNEISKSKKFPLRIHRNEIAYPSPYIKVYKVTFEGVDKTLINSWFITPLFTNRKKNPCVLHLHGYSNSFGTCSQYFNWAMSGFNVFAIDLREQGGITGNNAVSASAFNGQLVCKGILDKDTYYYKDIFIDCFRAIDVIASFEENDMDKFIIHGRSQGGGIGLALCALDSRPTLGLLDVPSLCDFEDRINAQTGVFGIIHEYLKYHPQNKEMVLKTLSYFDGINMADKIKCPVYSAVAGCDILAPAKNYLPAFRRIQTEKKLEFYEYSGHECAEAEHFERKIAYLQEKGFIV